MKFAKRLDAVPPYLFAELERKVSEAEKAGVDVISLGIGDPDLPTPPAVIDALAEAARDPRTHQYPTNHGTEEFRAAGGELLPRPLRRRARSGRRADPRARRQGRRRPHRARLPRPGRRLSGARPGLPAVHLRPGVRGRDRPLPAAARGERLLARPRRRARTPSCSTSTTRTTRRARPRSSISSSTRSGSPASAT